MKTRVLGPSAPSVSAVGLGGMPMSLSARPSEETSISVIHAALDAGVTLIDTADVYCLDDKDIGHNERLIAKSLKRWSGSLDSVVVATKGGLTRPQGRWERDARPEHLHAACDRSLKALGVDRIDLYQLHAPDMNVPFDESVGALAELQQAGKVRWIGLSNVSVEEIREAESAVEIVTVQNRLSPFFREALNDGVVEYCAEKGIGFLAYSPVGGSRLNIRLRDNEAVSKIAKRLGASPHAVVLAWVLAQGPTVIPIPGARSVEHILDSVGAASTAIGENDLKAIDSADFPKD